MPIKRIPPEGGGTDNHSALTNLNHDDHLQYWNAARGEAALVAAAITHRCDVLVEVSHDFIDSDTYNQYSTINEGLNRARALLLVPGNDWVEVKVCPGYWDEEGIRVSNSIVLSFEQGAFVRGPVVPTNQYPIAAPTMAALVILEGTGQIQNIRFKPQNPAIVAGALLVMSGEVPSQRALINGLFIDLVGESPAELNNWSSGLYIHDQGAVSGDQDLYNKVLILLNLQASWFLHDSSGDPIYSYDSHLIHIHSNAVLLASNMSVRTKFLDALILTEEDGGSATCFLENSALSNDDDGVDGYQIVSWNYASTFAALNTTLDVSTCEVDKSKLSLTRTNSIIQESYQQPGFPASKGSLTYALQRIKEDTEFAIAEGSSAKRNVALLATAVNFNTAFTQGAWSGMMVDDFSDASGIDGLNSWGYEVKDNLLYMAFEKFLENFESYADTPALNAVWVPSGAGITETLQVVGGAKVMRLAYAGATSSNTYARRVLSTSNADFDTWPVELRVRVSRTITAGADVPLYFRMTDGLDGYFEWTIQPSQVPSGGSFVDLVLQVPSSIVSPPAHSCGARAFHLYRLEFSYGAVSPGSLGYWDVDRVAVVSQQDFKQSYQVASFNAGDLVNWPLLGGVTASDGRIVGSSSYGTKSGVDPGMPWSTEKIFATSFNFSAVTKEVFRLWVRFRGTAVSSESRWYLEVTDTLGRSLRMDSAPYWAPVRPYGTDPTKPFWYPIYFSLADGVITGGSPNWPIIKKIKFGQVSWPMTSGSSCDFGLLELGRPSQVQSVAQDVTVENFDQVSPNLTFTMPWPAPPAAQLDNAQTMRVNVGTLTLSADNPVGNDVLGFSGYKDWTRNLKLMGSWQTIAKGSNNLKWRFFSMPSFYEASTYLYKHIVEGISVVWRDIS